MYFIVIAERIYHKHETGCVGVIKTTFPVQHGMPIPNELQCLYEHYIEQYQGYDVGIWNAYTNNYDAWLNRESV